MDFKADREKLNQGLRRFNTRGTTAMRDAVRLAIEHADRQAREDKKVLVVVTDDEDNTSSISRDHIVKAAQQRGVVIYAIGILTDIDDSKTRTALQERNAIAVATGGQAQYLKDVSEVDDTAHEIARVIRNQYTLAYVPKLHEPGGTYRKIEVTAQSLEPLTVITRAGYYATSGVSVAARPSERRPD